MVGKLHEGSRAVRKRATFPLSLCPRTRSPVNAKRRSRRDAMSSIPSRSNSIGWSQPFDAFSPTANERPPLNVCDFKGMDHRPLAAPSQRFRTIKIYPKDVAFIWRHSRAVIPLLSKEGRHIMNDITLKAEERHDWTSHWTSRGRRPI